MSEKATPGPWYVGTLNDALFVIDKPPRPSHDYMSDIPDVTVIATVSTLPGHIEDANARLIAAAPELLEAAKQALDWFEDWFEDAYGSGVKRRVTDQLRAAIQKATGEA